MEQFTEGESTREEIKNKLKLVYPNGEFTKEELEKLFRLRTCAHEKNMLCL